MGGWKSEPMAHVLLDTGLSIPCNFFCENQYAGFTTAQGYAYPRPQARQISAQQVEVHSLDVYEQLRGWEHDRTGRGTATSRRTWASASGYTLGCPFGSGKSWTAISKCKIQEREYLLTSNKSFGERGELMGDPILLQLFWIDSYTIPTMSTLRGIVTDFVK
ncbi:hypothetical protein Cdeb_00002 [Caldibacillus debilis GB1]|jgi:hypothetical protein|uniref:Uncharacterized protein n=1 Tax=Caldibacillus debilis GB1 TaxID=1339248 RepID=A0A420VH95_9BACI|nr:hypothetical protein Cdeb_00002 [Caldibacillus debilis GB1]